MVAISAQSQQFRPESVLYRPPAHYFRGALGRFPTGVAVITYDTAEGEHHGITVNSFSSVSLDPPLILFSLQHTVRSHQLLKDRPFTVNVLGAEQERLAMQFAGKPSLDPVWVTGGLAPRLADPLSWFECTPWAEYPGGDHTLFLGEVIEYGYRTGDALGFANGLFTTIHEPRHGHEHVI